MEGKSYFNLRFFDMQSGIEPLVIDWAKEEPKNNSGYLCLLLIIQFLSRLCNIFFSQIDSAEGVLPNDELKKNSFYCF